MAEPKDGDDVQVQRIRRLAARVAMATHAELVEEAHADGFGVSAYREFVARFAGVSTPPGVEWAEHRPAGRTSRPEPDRPTGP